MRRNRTGLGGAAHGGVVELGSRCPSTPWLQGDQSPHTWVQARAVRKVWERAEGEKSRGKQDPREEGAGSRWELQGKEVGQEAVLVPALAPSSRRGDGIWEHRSLPGAEAAAVLGLLRYHLSPGVTLGQGPEAISQQESRASLVPGGPHPGWCLHCCEWTLLPLLSASRGHQLAHLGAGESFTQPDRPHGQPVLPPPKKGTLFAPNPHWTQRPNAPPGVPPQPHRLLPPPPRPLHLPPPVLPTVKGDPR